MSARGARPRQLLSEAPLYAILDTALYPAGCGAALGALLAAGVKVIQYRHKGKFEREQWQECCTLVERTHEQGGMLIVNDRPDMAKLCAADGVHLGQDDVPIGKSRWFLGPEAIIGCSTHHIEQIEAALGFPVDYIAVGPVFATSSKMNPDPVVGLELVKSARSLTHLPVVAIGGITAANAASVLQAGADAVAVIGGLAQAPDIEARAREFLAAMKGARQRPSTQ